MKNKHNEAVERGEKVSFAQQLKNVNDSLIELIFDPEIDLDDFREELRELNRKRNHAIKWMRLGYY